MSDVPSVDIVPSVRDFALTKSLEVVVVLAIRGEEAACRYSYDHAEKCPVLFKLGDLIKLTPESGKLSLNKLNERIGTLNFRRHEIEDCLNYVD